MPSRYLQLLPLTPLPVLGLNSLCPRAEAVRKCRFRLSRFPETPILYDDLCSSEARELS